MAHSPERPKNISLNAIAETSIMSKNYPTAHACSGVRRNVKLPMIQTSELVWNELKLAMALAFKSVLAMTSNYSTAKACVNIPDDITLLTLT